MIQIPKNRIVEDQYTNGTGIGKNLALRFVRSKIPYIGFYNIVNGSKYFTGKTYDEKTSRPLEKYNIIQAAAGAVAAAQPSQSRLTKNTTEAAADPGTAAAAP